MVSENLVRSCLYNWLGYGKINSPIWFIGIEEGGAEIWREKTQTLESSLQLRKDFDISMDFYDVWEEQYGIDLNNFKGITVWHFIARFMLSYEGVSSNTKEIRDYIFNDKRLGSKNSDYFLCELFPLPKRSKNTIDGYEHVWPTIKEYHADILVERFNLIRNTLEDNQNIKLIVSYTRDLTEMILNNINSYDLIEIWSFNNKQYILYNIHLTKDRYIYLLSTPFFGQGQASYAGLDYAVGKVKGKIK